MKLRRIVPLMLAMMLVMSLFAGANAQYAITGSRQIEENGYATLSLRNNNIAFESRETRQYVLTDANGNALTSAPYIYMNEESGMFKVAVEEGLNTQGLIDAQGNQVVPMQYGDLIHITDRWQLGVVLIEATADNYDYKTFGGDTFYLVSVYDVYFNGNKVGSLDRLAYNFAYGYGNYLYVRDKEGNYSYYDSAMTPSPYVTNYPSSSEYDDTRDGVFHRATGQKAFAPGCTLTSADVDLDIFQVDGNFVDLQGNVLFPVNAKYETIYNFEGDYAKVRANGKYGLIDRTGREVLACEYDEISSGNYGYFEGGYQIVVKDDKVGFVNKEGQVTCDFKYSTNAVKSTYRMPMTHLIDMDGSVIVISGAVGELPQKYTEVNNIGYNGCPLFAAMIEEDKAGVVDLYGNVVIPMDGKYDDVYDFNISYDGTVIVATDVDRVTTVYTLADDGVIPELQAPADGSWTCTNGHSNTGKFCSECGQARPE